MMKARLRRLLVLGGTKSRFRPSTSQALSSKSKDGLLKDNKRKQQSADNDADADSTTTKGTWQDAEVSSTSSGLASCSNGDEASNDGHGCNCTCNCNCTSNCSNGCTISNQLSQDHDNGNEHDIDSHSHEHDNDNEHGGQEHVIEHAIHHPHSPHQHHADAVNHEGKSVLSFTNTHTCVSPSPANNAAYFSYTYGSSEEDPYADVREKLEALSARDRERFTHDGRTGALEDEEDDEASRDTAHHEQEEHGQEFKIPSVVAYTVYFAYAVLIFVGHVRDFLAYFFGGRYVTAAAPSGAQNKHLQADEDSTQRPDQNLTNFAPLLASWEHFYTRRLYARIQDVFNRPIASNPGATITVLERVSTDGQKSMQLLGPLHPPANSRTKFASQYLTDAQRAQYQNGKQFITTEDGSIARRCLNLGSYNYLGFADDWQDTCAYEVKGSLTDFPVSMSSPRNEYGTTLLHRQVEETVARFLGKEDALCLNMGFNTNATTIPALTGRGDLIVSDELNHTSIVNGARSSGAAIRIFRHNDSSHLEEVLREAIVMGRPRTRRPWNKILVIVEGIYSMEGEYCDLRNIARICKQYGAYIYLDEAHSIGAMGLTGRGCAEYTGVDTADIDIMMGTFTKSFGGMGGYIAASKETIAFLRRKCAGSAHHNSMSPTVCQQVLSSFKVIMGEDGTCIGKRKLQALRDNANYFRMRLNEMGLQVLGRYDSPIMPVMLYLPTKIGAFSRECTKRGLAVVVVGFPAVPILMGRARFCISAGHSRENLDMALREIDEVADVLKLRYNIRKWG